MKISVIIPTYKPKEYLYDCLTSIKKQSFSKNDFEIILILNGCKEPYESNINNFIKKEMNDYNVTFIQYDFGGVSRARNMALNISKGDYIIFIDDDDYISCDFLTNLYKKANRNNIVVSNFKSFIDGNNEKFYDDYVSKAYKNTISKDIFSRRSFLSSSCGKLISKSIISNRRFDTSLKNSEDAYFMFCISDKISQIELSEGEAIYYRRIRCSSASRRYISLKTRISDTLRMIRKFSYTYFSNPCNYNFLLYVSRIIATIKYNMFTRK